MARPGQPKGPQSCPLCPNDTRNAVGSPCIALRKEASQTSAMVEAGDSTTLLRRVESRQYRNCQPFPMKGFGEAATRKEGRL
jgi:hypothetical protein